MATTVARMTGAEFDVLPYEEGRKWELLNGQLSEVCSPTPRYQKIAARLNAALTRYLEQHRGIGDCYQDIEFAMDENDRVKPDVAIRLGDNAAQLDLDKIPVPGAPDIAIEVISPSERSAESNAKMRGYLEHGVAEVWQVYPRTRTIEIRRRESSRTVSGGDVTSELLPGFVLSLTDVFDMG